MKVFILLITENLKAAAQNISQYTILVHHLVEKSHSWAAILEKQWLRLQQLSRALCAQQTGLSIFDMH